MTAFRSQVSRETMMPRRSQGEILADILAEDDLLKSKWVCRKCGEPRDIKLRYCNSCKAAWMREWRKTHPLTQAQKKKDNSRSYANAYRKRGRLVPQPCEHPGCAETNVEMHHPDYNKPLEVVWLCRLHHLALHYPRRRTA